MMSFFAQLCEQTQQERQYLLSADVIKKALAGEVSTDLYVAFLQQAYHHVKHTVPLLMACGARIDSEQEWLRNAIAEYIEEELGHQEWILNDIAACGYDKEQVRNSAPSFATELMVSYAYDSIARVSPLAFFGMVHVLEGTSIALADNAAGHIREQLGLPKKAFTYLTSHGALDQEHVKFFEGLMNQITSAHDQAVIVHAAKRFYRLYGDIFHTLSAEHGINTMPLAQEAS
ncbi:TenA family transcriptional regulator [Pseudoalteromonas sp. SSDWG2]|uniref:TenA family transcriptional regulator n=1 Tax=Pseudoalteromonas sp. SSDWG2 TaxID=3139391 RepID=UPI003BA9B36E